MKKGLTTFEFLVAAILVLALAGVILYIVVPRLQHSPSFMEGFLPEKCVSTGLTRDDYLKAITDAASRLPPLTTKAVQLYNQMKTCFPDSEMPADLKNFLINQGIKKINFASLDDGKLKSMQTALQAYYNSKSLMVANEFEALPLILFARGIFHTKGSSAEAISLLDIVLKKKGVADPQLAEALYLKAAFLERDGRTAAAADIYKEVISKYDSKTADPSISFFVGKSKIVVGRAEKNSQLEAQGIKLIGESIYTISKNPSLAPMYISNSADFAYDMYYSERAVTDEDKKKSARLFEDSLLNRPGFSDAPQYQETVDSYSKLDEKYRSIKDCSISAIDSAQCLCKGSSIQTAKSCVCVIRSCAVYGQSEPLCRSDPCQFRGFKTGEVWGCEFVGGSCQDYSKIIPVYTGSPGG